MTIVPLTCADARWEAVADYAATCSWGAGSLLAQRMRSGAFNDWERVFAAFTDDGELAGYCTLAAEDCLPDVPYTPYIGMVFVGEPHRGHRLSEALLKTASDYAASLGFCRVFLVSDHVGLYEKYGFQKIDERPAPWNPERTETVFFHHTGRLPDVSTIIGRTVSGHIDRPMGSRHPKAGFLYPVNYGYIDGVHAMDGDEQDAYLLGVDEPVQTFTGKIIAVYHRFDDIEDKWIITPDGADIPDEEILRQIQFQEQFFHGQLCRRDP